MYEKWKKKYPDFLLKYSMGNIVYAFFILLTLGTAGFTGLFVSKNDAKRMDERIVSDSQELAEQMNASMSQYIQSMMRLSDTLYYNVIKNDDGAHAGAMFQAIYDAYKDSVESIALFGRDGSLRRVAPALDMAPYADIGREPWFRTAFESSENIHFSQPRLQCCFDRDEKLPWVISMSRYVQMTEGNKVTEGVLLIDIKYSMFSEMFQNSLQDGGNYTFLTDSDGELIYHPRHAMINAGAAERPPVEISGYKDGSYEMTLCGENVICCVNTVGYTGWKVISVLNRESQKRVGMKSSLFVVFVILQVLLISLLLSEYISRMLTKPVKDLELDVKRIAEGELDIKVHTAGSYEVYHLGRSIQKMAVEIQRLMKAIIREQEEKRKSELDSLQAQITPHFLYNTLDIIVWMVEEERKEEAADIVTALARLLRISLSKGKQIIPLEDELEHARHYLTIQSIRFKNQFTYRVEMEEGLQGLAVIKLIVQPIVENAIYHGMSGMYGDGLILVRAYREGDELYISIKDNGMGMPKEQADELLDYTKEVKTAKGNGLGVRNVHERIRLYFGEAYGVEIYSVVDEGTEILLHLPAQDYQEEEAGS